MLVGATFELIGEGAGQLVVDALFRGGVGAHSEGRKVTIAGPTGREALAGLKLAIVPRPPRAETAATSPFAPSAAPLQPEQKRPRVCVLRGGQPPASPPATASTDRAAPGVRYRAPASWRAVHYFSATAAFCPYSLRNSFIRVSRARDLSIRQSIAAAAGGTPGTSSRTGLALRR
jgi:hypothetical protein